MTKILIGVDGSERSDDAVAFGRALALAADAPVTLAMAHRSEPLRPGAEEHEAFLRDDAERTLVRLAAALDDVRDLELRPLVVNTSPAHALQATAEQEQAGIIVVGSSHTGRLGRVLPGSTAERLLHGAPCPVAVVPLGYRTQRDTFASGGRLRLPARPRTARPRLAPPRSSRSRCPPRCG